MTDGSLGRGILSKGENGGSYQYGLQSLTVKDVCIKKEIQQYFYNSVINFHFLWDILDLSTR